MSGVAVEEGHEKEGEVEEVVEEKREEECVDVFFGKVRVHVDGSDVEGEDPPAAEWKPAL